LNQPTAALADMIAPRETGATCAVATIVARDRLGRAAAYPQLYPAKGFDPAFYSSIALANTFCAPWLPADRLRMASRITMWIFAVDRLMDIVATSQGEIDDVMLRCAAIVDGADPQPDDALATYLAEIRDELATSPAWPHLHHVWREELHRMLASMARDWAWQSARDSGAGEQLPSLDSYLDQAEFGFSAVFVSHWIANTDEHADRDVAALLEAGRQVQRVIRILNDYGTYRRDVNLGDVSVLLLGVPRADVDRKLASLIEHCHRLLEPLKKRRLPLALYLERMIAFNTGFYALADYWGELVDREP
jgi:hypothetical protein